MNLKHEVDGTSVTHIDACSLETQENEHQVGDNVMSTRDDDCSREVNGVEVSINWTSQVLPIMENLCRKMGMSYEATGICVEYLAEFPDGVHAPDKDIIAKMRPTWSTLKVNDVFDELMHGPLMDSFGDYEDIAFLNLGHLRDKFWMFLDVDDKSNEACGIRLLETLAKHDRNAILNIYGCWLSEVCLDGNGHWICDPFELDAETIKVLMEMLELNRTHALCDAITMYGQALSTEKSCVPPAMISLHDSVS